MANGNPKQQRRRKPAASNGSQPEKPEAIISIETIAPIRPFATIDDVQHDFRLRREFGATEDREFNRDSNRYDELYSREDELDAAETNRMLALLDGLVDAIFVNAAALRAQMGDKFEGEEGGVIKRELLLAFTNAPYLMEVVAQRQKIQQAQKAGGSSTTAS